MASRIEFTHEVLPALTKLGCNQRLSRNAHGQERVPAQPARLQSDTRLRDARPRERRPSHQPV